MDQYDKQASGNGFDYNAVFAGATTEEAERKVSGKTVPSFPLYVVHVGGAKHFFTQKKGTPGVRPYVIIKEGLDGTEGTLVSDDLYLSVSQTTEEDGVQVPKTPEKFAADADNLVRKLNKIARIGNFGQNVPKGYDATALETYAAQFGANGGFDAILEIREVTETYEGVTRTRNRIVWESMAAPGDPADAKKAQKAGLDALGEARAKIAERNKAATGPKSGTAAATQRTNPASLFS